MSHSRDAKEIGEDLVDYLVYFLARYRVDLLRQVLITQPPGLRRS